jgi:hypothetical protein
MLKFILRQTALFITALVLFANLSFEAKAQATGYLEVVGSVSQMGKNLEGATITVMKGNEKIDQWRQIHC